MKDDHRYDVGIIGGGLAGLSASIQLARNGFQVIVFEKEQYPFHKVCGEYISMESWGFLESLGLPLETWNLPKITELEITSAHGTAVHSTLPLGGFGISRYMLDANLAGLAQSTGVTLMENTKVTDVRFESGYHQVQTSAGNYICSVACACYGKKSNLDVKWKRKFQKDRRQENYVGVKYHVKADRSPSLISLHNFQNGYCGISKIENDQYCLCYLTQSENLKRNGQSIHAMEENILKANPALRLLLDTVVSVYKEPVTIAQISFAKKTQVENHILYIGDAAGMITPLCGNGMSMALHASKIAAGFISAFLKKEISRRAMENGYRAQWSRQFAGRLRAGRILQRFFGKAIWSSLLVGVMKPFPVLIRWLIRKTHGEKF